MAAVDAVWRLHIRGEALHLNEGGTYKLFEFLCPNNSMKLGTNPTYHMLNDGFQHLVKAHLRVYWEEVTGEKDLHKFGERKPVWDKIESLAQKILNQHIGGKTLGHFQELAKTKHDMKHENQMLFNQDASLYSLLAIASSTGAMGLMKDLLWLWVPMFLACGKHKYAMHLLKFLQDLCDTYLERLSHIIQMHWLCNPKGTPDGFRGVDWWVELNNLYTKVHQDCAQAK